MFSASGLVDSALRNRLKESTIEMLTVVQCSFRRVQGDGAVKAEFWALVKKWLLDADDGLPQLERVLNGLKMEL